MMEKLAKAIEHRSNERFEEAKRLLAELYSKDPDNADVNYHYAWLHDKMGEERIAVPYYERAIKLGLAEKDLNGAMLGLGSTYRTLGEYNKAIDILRYGMSLFPEAQQFPTFLSMALYNIGRHAEAMELLLKILATTSNNPDIKHYKQAILFYAVPAVRVSRQLNHLS